MPPTWLHTSQAASNRSVLEGFTVLPFVVTDFPLAVGIIESYNKNIL